MGVVEGLASQAQSLHILEPLMGVGGDAGLVSWHDDDCGWVLRKAGGGVGRRSSDSSGIGVALLRTESNVYQCLACPLGYASLNGWRCSRAVALQNRGCQDE